MNCCIFSVMVWVFLLGVRMSGNYRLFQVGIMVNMVMVVMVGCSSGRIMWKKMVSLFMLLQCVVFFSLFGIWCMNLERIIIVSGRFCVVQISISVVCVLMRFSVIISCRIEIVFSWIGIMMLMVMKKFSVWLLKKWYLVSVQVVIVLKSMISSRVVSVMVRLLLKQSRKWVFVSIFWKLVKVSVLVVGRVIGFLKMVLWVLIELMRMSVIGNSVIIVYRYSIVCIQRWLVGLKLCWISEGLCMVVGIVVEVEEVLMEEESCMLFFWLLQGIVC